ncbi:hypothetical protein PR002_g10553 [Phytophthora rubi]|uniref:HAT C-terminal dimerisation domain-containing protein n=1 Tax=Phytophthora rubi TaxID=129364 RepID=A0A6A3MED1_9STRA|nr:hypothetical protein PR002_g10553 [Phytophthora rubi]
MLDQTKSMVGHDSKKMIDAATCLARDLNMVDEEQEDAFHKQLQEFVLDKGRWQGEDRRSNDRYSPLNWWALPDIKYDLVQQFAKVLLSTPTSSASSERSWSIHGFIHTKLRNRLTPERVNNLVFVYTNIARKSEVYHIMYELFPDACDDCDSSDDSDSDEESNTLTTARSLPVPATDLPEGAATITALQGFQDANSFTTPVSHRRSPRSARTSYRTN